jgi:hypothetical protein
VKEPSIAILAPGVVLGVGGRYWVADVLVQSVSRPSGSDSDGSTELKYSQRRRM